MANEAERVRWNDEEWTEAWTQRERLTDAVLPTLLEAAGPQPGQRVCDIGCGGGHLTIALAERVRLSNGAVAGGERVPGGEAVGVDISAPLVELARRRAAGAPGVRFVVADVQSGSVVEDPFDLAVSQFGVMFFDEPVVAFDAIRRLLRPGGRFVFACWQGLEHNPWHAGTALGSLLPAPPAPPPGMRAVGPFVLGEDTIVRRLLAEAGFASVRCVSYEKTARGPASAVVDRVQLKFMGVPAGQLDLAMDLVLAHLERFALSEGEYEFPLAFRVYDAVTGVVDDATDNSADNAASNVE